MRTICLAPLPSARSVIPAGASCRIRVNTGDDSVNYYIRYINSFLFLKQPGFESMFMFMKTICNYKIQIHVETIKRRR